MARLKINSNRKAISVPISLKPKHVAMLDELSTVNRKNRSKVIQELIEGAYISASSNLKERRDKLFKEAYGDTDE